MAVCTSSKISGETLEKAIKELNENPNTREEAISELRRSIEAKEGEPEFQGVSFERKDDSFLLRFLRARKFDQERSLSLYTNYYKNRRDFPKIFSDFTPQSVADLLCSGAINVLDGRMNDGSKVICIHPVKWNMDRYEMELMIRTILLVVDKLLEDEETQVHGVSIFQYQRDVEFARIWRFSQTEAIQNGVFINILQEGIPLRLKGVHFLCQPWYISIVLTIGRPFMKEKLRQRLHLHGYDFTNLHQLIDIGHLPEELGGSLSSLDQFRAVRLFSDELGNIEELLTQVTAETEDTSSNNNY